VLVAIVLFVEHEPVGVEPRSNLTDRVQESAESRGGHRFGVDAKRVDLDEVISQTLCSTSASRNRPSSVIDLLFRSEGLVVR
jgi:hypothetical protein